MLQTIRNLLLVVTLVGLATGIGCAQGSDGSDATEDGRPAASGEVTTAELLEQIRQAVVEVNRRLAGLEEQHAGLADRVGTLAQQVDAYDSLATRVANLEFDAKSRVPEGGDLAATSAPPGGAEERTTNYAEEPTDGTWGRLIVRNKTARAIRVEINQKRYEIGALEGIEQYVPVGRVTTRLAAVQDATGAWVPSQQQVSNFDVDDWQTSSNGAKGTPTDDGIRQMKLSYAYPLRQVPAE